MLQVWRVKFDTREEREGEVRQSAQRIDEAIQRGDRWYDAKKQTQHSTHFRFTIYPIEHEIFQVFRMFLQNWRKPQSRLSFPSL